MPSSTARGQRAEATRTALLNAAERLFAEEGLFAVSNRQIGEAAGQGNNTAVGYHFGTKADLVRAIVRRHADPIEDRRVRMVGAVRGSDDPHDWITCLVRPVTDHLAGLGAPTWFARFAVQVTADPGFRRILFDEALSGPSLHEVLHGLGSCVPDLPEEVRLERGRMLRHLLLNTCADREWELARGEPALRATWEDTATGLIDALVGLTTVPAGPGSGGPSLSD